MKTIRSEKTIKNLDNLKFGFWDDEADEFVHEAADVKAHLGLSDKAYDSIEMFVADIKQYIGDDLKDIWDWLELLDRKVHE